MKNRRIWVLVLLVLTVGCDHATKAVASDRLEASEAVSVVPGVLDLQLHENHGVAFNLERWLPARMQRPVVFIAGTLVLGLLLFVWLRGSSDAPTEHAAYALIVAGAIGNLADRIIRGYVVDFIHVTHWPVFNVADIAIVVGVALMLWSRRHTVAAT